MRETPVLFRYVRPMLAYILTIGALGMIYMILMRVVPSENETILQVILGFVLSKFNDIYGYYFGTSKDKSDAEQQQRTPNTETSVVTKTEEIK